jgi:glycosyltransferase involved in cell wall biosynthesis
MRIAMVGARTYPPRHGGLEVVVARLSAELTSRGHEVHLIVSENQGDLAPAPIVHRVPALRSKYTHTLSQVVYSAAIVRKQRPDIVHIHGVGGALPIALSRSFLGPSPVVVTSHGMDWERAKWPRVAKAVFRVSALRALRKCTSVVTVSSSDADCLRASLSRNVDVIPNGIDYSPRPTSDSAVGAEGDPICVVASRLTPEKDIRTVIDAYDESVFRCLGKLVIVGSGAGSYAQDYERSLRQAAPPWVSFTGHVPHAQLLSMLTSASAFVSMSRLEGLPMAVLEATSAGTRLVLSDILPHRAIAGDIAEFVTVGDVLALRRALLRASARERPHDVVVAKQLADFRWDRVAAAYEELYEALI